MKNKFQSRRMGDTVTIPGNYQYNAARSGNAIQRLWHYTKQTAIDALCPPQKDAFVLDVGCGSGVISDYLTTKYQAKVIGIDGNPNAIQFATSTFPSTKFLCRHVDDELTLDEYVDNIYCLELIEHIYPEQAKVLLNHFHRLLKPKGKLFLTTPNYKSLWPVIETTMDLLNLAPKLADEQHVTFYQPKSLGALITSSGFNISHIGTNCMLAPWVAPLSLRTAKWLDKKELESKHLLGSIIIIVAEKQG